MATTKRTVMLFFVFAALMVSGAAIAWSCTVIVSNTETSGTSSADSGDPVTANSEVVHSKEANSNCDNGDSGSTGCDYSLGIVNPDKVANSTGSGGVSDSCHYETEQSHNADPSTNNGNGPQFDTIDDNPNHDNQGSETKLDGSGTVGNNDDAGDPMGSGETLMCFYSSDSDPNADHVNNAEDGAATATEPTTIMIN